MFVYGFVIKCDDKFNPVVLGEDVALLRLEITCENDVGLTLRFRNKYDLDKLIGVLQDMRKELERGN